MKKREIKPFGCTDDVLLQFIDEVILKGLDKNYEEKDADGNLILSAE